jgi:LPXTG-motif cell wall-anchored protein
MNTKLILGLALLGIAGYMIYKKKKGEKKSSEQSSKPEPAKLEFCEKEWHNFRIRARFAAGTDLEKLGKEHISRCLGKL